MKRMDEIEIAAFRLAVNLHDLTGAHENLNAATERAAAAACAFAAELQRADDELLAGLGALEDDFYAGRGKPEPGTDAL